MRDRGETEAYLAAELDSLQQAYAAGDQAAVTRRIKHVSDESGQETAAVLEQMLKEREALRPPLARPTTQTAPQDGVHKLPPPRSRKLVVAFLTVTVVALLLVIAVLVTVIIVRPSTTTTMPFPMQATGHPAETTAPPSTSTETTTTTVPIPVEPSEQKWTPVWPGLRQLTMPPNPGSSEFYTADLDVPEVTQSSQYSDIYYDKKVLKQGSALLMGAGPVTVPTPQDCYYDAQSQTVGPVEPLDMIPGKSAWCLLTKKGNLVWLHLLSGGGYGDAIPLRLELMQWKKINVSPAPK